MGPRWRHGAEDEEKYRKEGPQAKMFKNLRKTYVFEGCEAPEEGQVGPKMAPSWAQMGSGRSSSADVGRLEGDLGQLEADLGS